MGIESPHLPNVASSDMSRMFDVNEKAPRSTTRATMANGHVKESSNASNASSASNAWCLEPELVTAEGRYTPIPRFSAHDDVVTDVVAVAGSMNLECDDFGTSSSSAFSEDLCITTNNRGDIHVHGSATSTASAGSTGATNTNTHTNTSSSSSSSYSAPAATGTNANASNSNSNNPNRANLLLKTKEQLVDEILSLRSRQASWEELTSQIVSALALAPDSNAMYSRLLRTILCTALKSVVSIQHIRHVECSLPSLPTERPKLSLINISNMSSTTCISDSRWRIDWKPASWWVSVAATGSKWGLAFNALTTVSHISISGVVKTRFSEDLTAMRLAFVDEPQLDMTVKSEVAMAVGMGVYNMGIPVPVEEQIEDVIRNELRRFIMDTLVGKNSSVIVLRRKPTNPVSKEDLEEAISAAHRANAVQLRSVK